MRDSVSEWRPVRAFAVMIMAISAATACGGHGGSDGTDGGAPDAPAAPGPVLTAAPGESHTHLSWTAVDGAAHYRVYRADAPGTAGTLLQTVTAPALDDTSVTNFAPYWYEVTGVTGDGASATETAPSNQASAFGYDLAHWTVRQSGFPLAAVAYAPANANPTGHDVYVAVGAVGRVLVSADGLAWSAQPALPVQVLSAITFGGGLFVAVGLDQANGTHSIFTSPDGQTWTARDAHTPQPLQSVTYGITGSLIVPVGHYVAVGAGGTIVTSPDGVTWTPATYGMGTFTTVNDVQHTGTSFAETMLLVAAGQGVAYTSLDGVAWTPVNFGGTATGLQFYSSAPDPTATAVWLVATTGTIDVVTRANPTTAAAYAVPPATGQLYSGAGSYVDAAQTRHVVLAATSGGLTDCAGATPTGCTALAAAITGTPAEAPLFVEGFAVAGSALISLGNHEQILTSTDHGATLRLVRDDPGGFNAGVYSHGGTTVIDHRGQRTGEVLTSTDGATFALGLTGATTAMVGLAGTTTPTGFALVYSETAGTGLDLYESADATSWTHTAVPLTLCATCTPTDDGTVVATTGGYLISTSESAMPVPNALAVRGSAAAGFTTDLQTPNTTFESTARIGGAYVALTPSAVLSSTDGVTWTAATLPAGMDATAYLATGTGAFVADAAGRISRSTDGVTWSAPAPLDPAGRYVAQLVQLGDELLALGSGGLCAVSTDGATWTPVDLHTAGDLYSATLTDRGLVVVGAYDVVVTAP